MKNFKNIDLFDKLKLDIVKVCIDLTELKQDIILLLLTNNWILQDMNLFENYTKLQEMIEESDKRLESLINETMYLEKSTDFFSIEDIVSESNYIRENIYLEILYFINIIFYMTLVDDYLLSPENMKKLLDAYIEIEEFCYSNVKINNKQIKILKKERGDHIE